MRSLAAVSALAVASAPLLAGPAMSADTTLGQTFSDSTRCGNGFTLLQAGLPQYAAPAAGVLTSWSHTNSTEDAYDIAFRAGRSAPESTYTVTAAPAAITVGAGETSRQELRVPVQAGDVIGFYMPRQDGKSSACVRPNNNPDSAYAFGPGDSATLTAGAPGYELNVSATYEADADGDGYGDTTQDQCPTDASTQDACAATGDQKAPETTITKVTSNKVKANARGKKARADVTVTFEADEASTFECKVGKRDYAPCTSPLKVRLKATKHTVRIRATDTAGNVDPTPAVRTFEVKRAKAKK